MRKRRSKLIRVTDKFIREIAERRNDLSETEVEILSNTADLIHSTLYTWDVTQCNMKEDKK